MHVMSPSIPRLRSFPHPLSLVSRREPPPLLPNKAGVVVLGTPSKQECGRGGRRDLCRDFMRNLSPSLDPAEAREMRDEAASYAGVTMRDVPERWGNQKWVSCRWRRENVSSTGRSDDCPSQSNTWNPRASKLIGSAWVVMPQVMSTWKEGGTSVV